MISQPELQFDPPPRPEAADEERLQELIAILAESGGWLTRRALETLGFGERELRELGERDQEGRIFSHPGSPGYKLFDMVTDQEFDRCIALKNQGRKMLRKWLRYQRRWHARFKPREHANA